MQSFIPPQTNNVPQDPIFQGPPPQKNQNSKIFFFNLLVFAVYYVIAYALPVDARGHFGAMATGIVSSGYMFHAFLLLVLAIINVFRKDKAATRMYLLSMVAIIIIGFGACTVSVLGLGKVRIDI
jgi:hypothetical protein